MTDVYQPEPPPLRRHTVSPEEEAAHRRALWLKRAVVGLCVTVIVLCVATTSVTVITIRLSQTSNRDVVDRIQDCTTPGRPCYDRGQKQLSDTVAGLNRYGIIVAACASGPVERSVEEITACVVDKLPNPDHPRAQENQHD